jgi:hypothetical protein
MLPTQSIIDQINTHHENVKKQIIDATESAIAIGNLLQEVKANLPHGELIPWIEKHLMISVRQAQRYMTAAKRKSLPLRNLIGKYDTVSHLPRPKNMGTWKGDRWEPEPGCMYLFKENDANYWVHPCSDGSYWFHVCKLYNGSRMNTDGFYRCYTIFGTVDDPNLTSRYYVGTNSPLGWLGVGEVLKSYGLRDIEKSLSFGKKIHGGLERPFGEPQSQNWYWGEDGEWDDREAYFESLIKTADR